MKPEPRKAFVIAMRPTERRLVDEAADICDERPTTWARGQLIDAARRVLAQAPQAERGK